MRFDFTHFEAVTPEELRAIEEQVNEEIWKATPVTTIETDIDTAKSMGAMALFGEKYGKNVRVVSIGDYSVELCGGTHVANTAEIGMFKIVKEEGIGSGTRRILAVTSREAYLAYREEEDALKAIAATLKAPQLKEVPNKVVSLQEQLHALQKKMLLLKKKQQLQQLVMSSKTLKKLTVFVTSLAKWKFLTQVLFVPLQTNGNKQTTLTSLSLQLTLAKKLMSL